MNHGRCTAPSFTFHPFTLLEETKQCFHPVLNFATTVVADAPEDRFQFLSRPSLSPLPPPPPAVCSSTTTSVRGKGNGHKSNEESQEINPRKGARSKSNVKQQRRTKGQTVIASLPVQDLMNLLMSSRQLENSRSSENKDAKILINPTVVSPPRATSKDEHKVHPHVDVVVQFEGPIPNKTEHIKVLERRPYLEADELQDEYLWIQLVAPLKKDSGWLHDESVTMIAQQIAGGFFLMHRQQLLTHVFDRLPCDASSTTDIRSATYGRWKRNGRRETFTLVPAADILGSDIVPFALLLNEQFVQKATGCAETPLC